MKNIIKKILEKLKEIPLVSSKKYEKIILQSIELNKELNKTKQSLEITEELVDKQMIVLDRLKINNWLFEAYKNKGFQHYYTYRKNKILNGLTSGVENKEYWKSIGRIEELKKLRFESIEVAKLKANEKLKTE